MKKVRELLKILREKDRLDCLMNNLKQAREVQRLSVMVKAKNLDLQTMPELVEEVSNLREELSKLKEDKDCLEAMNKALALGSEISDLKNKK